MTRFTLTYVIEKEECGGCNFLISLFSSILGKTISFVYWKHDFTEQQNGTPDYHVVFISFSARYFYFAPKDFKRRLRGGKAEILKVYKEEPIGGIVINW